MSIEVYHATLFVGVENILDTQYPTFSSGINAQEGIYMEITIQL
jgi:outer membrane receptor protein involved in Fe transport